MYLDHHAAAVSWRTEAAADVVEPSSADKADTAGKPEGDPCNHKVDSMVGIDPEDTGEDPQDTSVPAPAHLELAAASLHHLCPLPPVNSAPGRPFFGDPLMGTTSSLAVVVVEC